MNTDAMARSWAQDVIRCQYCEEEPAQFHCVPCGDELCPRCKTFHLKSKVPTGHNVIRISERLEPTNMIKMCETHPSKPYDACCEDCQVPVCIICIQEIHNKHGIGKMQDMYEKQKAEALKELSEMKTQKRAGVIQKLKDVENRESKIKSNHENVRKAMHIQAEHFKNHIDTILSKGLSESDSDEKSKLKELSQNKIELEDYQRKVEDVIDKLENLTELSHPAELILYRKQNSDVIKHLKCPNTVVTTDPTFTAGEFDQTQNEKQFGKITSQKQNENQFGRYTSKYASYGRTRYEEHAIEKLENFAEPCDPADLFLYRKQNPDDAKQLKCLQTVVTSDSKFPAFNFNFGHRQNEEELAPLPSIFEINTSYMPVRKPIRRSKQSATRVIDQEVQTEIVPNEETATCIEVTYPTTVGYPAGNAAKVTAPNVTTVSSPAVQELR